MSHNPSHPSMIHSVVDQWDEGLISFAEMIRFLSAVQTRRDAMEMDERIRKADAEMRSRAVRYEDITRRS